MLTVAALMTEGRQPSQDELEQVRLSAITLYSRYPDLTYGQHSLESWSEVCKLMEFQAAMATETGRPSYSMAKQAFWCMKRPFKAEKLWTQLNEAERQLVKVSMVLPVCLGRMQVLAGQDAMLPLAPDSDTLDTLRRSGIATEWLTVLGRWHSHYMANGELKARVLADIRDRETTSHLLSVTSTLAGFLRVVVSRWSRWSTTVCLELGTIADRAVRDSLANQGIDSDQLTEPLQLEVRAQATSYQVSDRGLPGAIAYGQVSRLLPAGAFASLSDVIAHPDYSSYQANIVDAATQVWQTMTQHLFYKVKPQDSLTSQMAALGYNFNR